MPGTRAQSAVVVGGGLAGTAAAAVLAERGVRVKLVEKEPFLGGRAAGWTDRLADGEPFQMERGFHAFFRQYYNLRALLRRLDPALSGLVPLEDYPILGPGGEMQSFRRLPRKAPWNVAALLLRAPSIRWRDLARANARAALEMLAFDATRTYARFDRTTAREHLDSLRLPDGARRMLFDVFAHSFFNPEEGMSAGELLMMFHFYFLGNPEGLVFDVMREPFSTALWQPMERYLGGLGVDVLLGRAAERLSRGPDGWQVEIAGGAPIHGQALLVAVTVPALRALVAASPDLDDAGWRCDVAALETAPPFAVWRLWLDRPTCNGRHPFAGTSGMGLLDNISLYHLFQGESGRWAARTGGAVVELHAYALPPGVDGADLRRDLLDGLHALYPETRAARILEDRFLWQGDAPAFGPGSHSCRPGVATPFAGLALAGDFVKLDFPTALMERAVASGFLAANHLLAGWGIEGEKVRSVPRRGILACPLGCVPSDNRARPPSSTLCRPAAGSRRGTGASPSS